MKYLLLAALLFAPVSMAFADALPLIEKFSGTGYTPIEYVRTEQCAIYFDKAVIMKSYGVGDDQPYVSFTQTIPIQISTSIKELIKNAAQEPVESNDDTPCDGPSTLTRANGASQVVLFDTGGCGSPRQVRNGPASNALRDIVDQFCPLTYDFDHNRKR